MFALAHDYSLPENKLAIQVVEFIVLSRPIQKQTGGKEDFGEEKLKDDYADDQIKIKSGSSA